MDRDKTPAVSVEGPREVDARFVVPALRCVQSPDLSVSDRSLTFMSTLSFGRSDDPNVTHVLGDGLLSRKHVRFTHKHDTTIAEDLGSTNGTFVNGVRAARVELRPGDVIRLGDSVFLFERVDKREVAPPTARPDEFTSRVSAMHALERDVLRVAASTVPVLVLGETGSGKDVLCRRIHARSKRAGAFIAVNCGAITSELAEAHFFGHKRGAFTGAQQDAAGVFVSADDGTVFLDELGELPYGLQAKILRVLDSNEVVPVGSTVPVKVAFRLVAATNVDLVARVQANEFRRDLYARVAGMVLRVPPLRERKADIVPLLRWFWPQARPLQLSAGFIEKLLLHDWSMNVRELKALVSRLLLHETNAFEVQHCDLAPMPSSAAQVVNEPTMVRLPERERLVALLEEHKGNVAHVAKRLGVDRKQIYRWMKAHQISASERAGK